MNAISLCLCEQLPIDEENLSSLSSNTPSPVACARHALWLGRITHNFDIEPTCAWLLGTLNNIAGLRDWLLRCNCRRINRLFFAALSWAVFNIALFHCSAVFLAFIDLSEWTRVPAWILAWPKNLSVAYCQGKLAIFNKKNTVESFISNASTSFIADVITPGALLGSLLF